LVGFILKGIADAGRKIGCHYLKSFSRSFERVSNFQNMKIGIIKIFAMQNSLA
jgi:hypothetical protein